MVVGLSTRRLVLDELGGRVISLHLKDGARLPSAANARAVRERGGRARRHRHRLGRSPRAIDLPRDRAGSSSNSTIATGSPLEAVRRRATTYLVTRGLGRGSRRVTAVEPARVDAARVGIVGCGNVTDLYLPRLRDGSRRSSWRPARTSMPRTRGGAVREGRVPGHGRSTRCWPTPSIEIVLNLTPPDLHAEVARAAIAAGKHVYTEKPLATGVADAPRRARRRRRRPGCSSAVPPRHVPRRGHPDGPRAHRRRARSASPIGANAAVLHLGPGALAPQPGTSSMAPAAGRCSTSGRTTSPPWSALLGPVASVAAVARGAGGASGGSRRGRGPARRSWPRCRPTRRRGLPASHRGRSAGSRRRSTSAASASPHIEIPRHRGLAQPRRPEPFRRGRSACRAIDGDEEWMDVPLAVRWDASGAASASPT